MNDVLVLIDRLDDAVSNGSSSRMGTQVKVNREEAYAVLAEMRANIPDELKNARWITRERQAMLDEARREAERTLRGAREERDRIVGGDGVARQAELHAERIVENASARERQIRLRSEDYADEILKSLEISLERFRAAVQRGRERLRAAG
jgi:hypothetical protein